MLHDVAESSEDTEFSSSVVVLEDRAFDLVRVFLAEFRVLLGVVVELFESDAHFANDFLRLWCQSRPCCSDKALRKRRDWTTRDR